MELNVIVTGHPAPVYTTDRFDQIPEQPDQQADQYLYHSIPLPFILVLYMFKHKLANHSDRREDEGF